MAMSWDALNPYVVFLFLFVVVVIIFILAVEEEEDTGKEGW